MHRAGVGDLMDQHRQRAGLARLDQGGDLEAPPRERPVNVAQRRAVNVNIGLPVDALEVQPDPPALVRLRHGQGVPVPEVVPAEEAVGELEALVGVERVGDGADVEVAGQHGAGHGGGDPVVVVEAEFGDLLGAGRHERRALQPPLSAGQGQGAVGALRRLGSRGRGGGRRAVNLELVEGVAAGGCARRQGQADEARARGWQGDVLVVALPVGGGVDVLPAGGRIGSGRDLHLVGGGVGVVPVETDAVEEAVASEVNIDPLGLVGSAPPVRLRAAVGGELGRVVEVCGAGLVGGAVQGEIGLCGRAEGGPAGRQEDDAQEGKAEISCISQAVTGHVIFLGLTDKLLRRKQVQIGQADGDGETGSGADNGKQALVHFTGAVASTTFLSPAL